MFRIVNQIRRTYSTKTFTKTNEWYLKQDNCIKIGLTKKAIDELNEIVYIEFPNSETDIIDNKSELVIIESVKAIGYINSPDYKTEIIEHNYNLESNLDMLNENPEDETNSWLIKIKSL